MNLWQQREKELKDQIPKQEESNKRRLPSQDSTQSKLNAPKTRKMNGADSLSFLNQSESSAEHIESVNTTVESMDHSNTLEIRATVDQLEAVVEKMVTHVFQPKLVPTTWFELFVMPIFQDTVYLFSLYLNHKPEWGYLQGKN